MVQAKLILTVGMIVSLFVPAAWASVLATKNETAVGDLVPEFAELRAHRIKRAPSRRTVIVRNNANDWLRLWCASKDDSFGEKRLNPGDHFSFSFFPLEFGGDTLFWCTLDYRTYWARWDVFRRYDTYGFNNRDDTVFEYQIRDDGVHYRGRKIRGLASGQYKYTLWEHYDSNKNPHGTSLTGFVDSGMCNNIPGFMEAKTSDVTLCDNSCVILYDKLHCHGETSRLHAPGGCMNFYLTYFNDRARSVKGC